jgi:type I restriction enzyme M protein
MDASQYKDYVLFLLFIKYISDKYGDSDDFAPPVTIPKGASFKGIHSRGYAAERYSS